MKKEQPAFPQPDGLVYDGAGHYIPSTTVGMSMRQYYKAAALTGIMSDIRYREVGNENACAYEIARYAGLIADAMLAEDAAHAAKTQETKP